MEFWLSGPQSHLLQHAEQDSPDEVFFWSFAGPLLVCLRAFSVTEEHYSKATMNDSWHMSMVGVHEIPGQPNGSLMKVYSTAKRCVH